MPEGPGPPMLLQPFIETGHKRVKKCGESGICKLPAFAAKGEEFRNGLGQLLVRMKGDWDNVNVWATKMEGMRPFWKAGRATWEKDLDV